MRSYGLGIAFGMVIAAIFAFQNAADVVVRFIVWERVLPQGVWEVSLFAAGAVAMWFISLSAILEIKGKNSKLLKEQKKTIEAKDEELDNIREERKSLLIAMRKSGIQMEKEPEYAQPGWKQDLECYTCEKEEILKEQHLENENEENKGENLESIPDQGENSSLIREEDQDSEGEDSYDSDFDRAGDNYRF